MALLRNMLLSATLVIGAYSPTYGLTEVTKAIVCPAGSALDVGWVTYIFNERGGLVSAGGVCCDGSVWWHNYGIISPGGGGPFEHLNATINGPSSNLITVSANMEIDIRIIDIRTGQYVTELYRYTQINTPFAVNIAHLPFGLYGVVLSSNGSPINVLPFSKSE